MPHSRKPVRQPRAVRASSSGSKRQVPGRPRNGPPDPTRRFEDLTPEERRKLIRDFLSDSEAMDRAARRHAEGLSEDAAPA